MQKTNFIIHFFLEILHFKESCNLIGWQHQEIEFCQIWDWWWNINNNISFHYRLLPRKTNDKIILKIQKEPILGSFYPNLGKNKFSWKKELCQFLDIPITSHCAKNQKKLLSNFWGNHQVGRLQAWKYIILPHLVLLIEYNTEVSEVFQNFIICFTFFIANTCKK